MNLNPLSDCEKNFILEAAAQKIVSKITKYIFQCPFLIL